MKKNLFYIVMFLISATSFAQLSGTYTVGPSGSFANPNEAVLALNAQGISGTVTFSIEPGTYDVSASIQSFSTSSPTDKVIFTSSTGNAEDVIWEHNYSSSEPYLLQIDSGRHIVFEYLTFNPLNYNKAIEIEHTLDLTVRNCIFFRTTQSSYYGSGGFINLNHSNESTSDSLITIQNNYFEKGNIGVNLYTLGTSNIYKINISDNTFYEQGYAGCYISNVNDTAIIKNNNIFSTYQGVSFGIYADRLNDFAIISNNNISLQSQTSSGYNCIGLCFSNSSVQQTPQVFNNLVYVKNATSIAYGLYISNGNYCNVQFNTSIVDGTDESSAFFFRFSADNYVVKNNNLINYGTSGYVFRTYDTHDVTSEISIFDYNNCYTNSTYFCRWVGNEYSLQDFRTVTSYAFLNHLTQIPSSFVVTDDNYAYSCESLQGSGIYDTLITLDYNNVTRPNIPTVGAIEYADTNFVLIDAEWTSSCGADSNLLSLINITDPTYSNVWLLNNDTIVENIVDFNHYINSTAWVKINLLI